MFQWMFNANLMILLLWLIVNEPLIQQAIYNMTSRVNENKRCISNQSITEPDIKVLLVMYAASPISQWTLSTL